MKVRLVKKYMKLAIKEAAKNLTEIHGGPFGACIVRDNKVVAVSRNTVLKSGDPTAHAEINAIREACKKLKTHDLSGCIIYSTTEPCPMCFSAIHWAKIDVVVYGTTISDAKKAGFNELCLSNRKIKSMTKSGIRLFPRFLYEDALPLFLRWDKLEGKVSY